MATQLYEVLEIRQDASPEEVRKAYKRLALKTHPDRLPPGSTSADKAAAEEKFRKVNNAYEILSNEENRKIYDQFGVFPPPTAEPNGPSSSSRSRRGGRDPFDDPFFSGAGFFGGSPFGTREGPFGPRGGSFFPDPFANDPFFSRRTRGFTFTDPFELFDAFFGVPHERERGPSGRAEPFGGFGGRQDPFGAFGGLFGGMGSSMLALPSAFGTGSGSGTRSYSMTSTGFGTSSGGDWTSESVSTTTVNGVTTTVREKRDAQGNVHRTKIYPDGREVYTINGVEQKKIDSGENKRKALEDGSSSRKRGSGSGERGGGDSAVPPPARGESGDSSSSSMSSNPYSSHPPSSSHHSHRTSSRHGHSGAAKDYYDEPHYKHKNRGGSHHTTYGMPPQPPLHSGPPGYEPGPGEYAAQPQYPAQSQYSAQPQYGAPQPQSSASQSQYGAPPYGAPQPAYGAPQQPYGAPQPQYQAQYDQPHPGKSHKGWRGWIDKALSMFHGHAAHKHAQSS